MAVDYEKEIAGLKREAEKVLEQLPGHFKLSFSKVLNTLKDSSEDAFNTLAKEVEKLNESYKALDDTAISLYKSVQATQIELSKDPAKLLVKEFNKVAKISKELADNEAGITNLTKGQLIRKREVVNSAVRELKELIKTKDIQESIRESTSLTARAKEELSALVTEENEARDRGEQKTTLNRVLEKARTQINLQTEVNKALGLTGAFLENVNKVGVRAFGGIGINLGILGEGLTRAKEDAEELASAMARGEIPFNRLKVLRAALPGIREGLMGALTDPLTTIATIGTTIVKNFSLYNQASIEFSRQTGQAVDSTILLNNELVSGAEVIKFMVEGSAKLGRNIQNVFSKDVITSAAEFQKMIGISAEEALGLAKLTQVTGTSMDGNLDKLARMVSNFNLVNKSSLSARDILKQVGNVSDGISASFAGSVEELVKASNEAQRLGMTLQELDSIASSLLDFESSIEAELEAQLLTGKAINLTKAREFALTGELDKMGKELFNNSATLLEFSNYNRIQQESYAKSLGISRDQLAKIAYNRALDLGMTREQAEAATKISAEEMKRLSVQESIATSVAKLAEAFAPILDNFSKFAASTTGMSVIIGGLVLIVAGKLYLGISRVREQFEKTALAAKNISKETAKAAATTALMKNKSTGFYAGGTYMPGGGRAPKGGKQIPTVIPPGSMFGGLKTGSKFLGKVLSKIIPGLGIVSLLFDAFSLLSNVTSMADGVIDSKGGLLVSGPKGSIQLDKDDTIVAGTNLGGGNSESLAIAKENNMLLKSMLSELKKKQNIYLGHAYRLNEGLEVYS